MPTEPAIAAAGSRAGPHRRRCARGLPGGRAEGRGGAVAAAGKPLPRRSSAPRPARWRPRCWRRAPSTGTRRWLPSSTCGPTSAPAQVFDVGRRSMLRAGLHWIAVAAVRWPAAARAAFAFRQHAAARTAQARGALARRRPQHPPRHGSMRWPSAAPTTAPRVRWPSSRRRADMSEWSGYNHVGRRARLSLSHLMASMAVPLMFPPEQIGEEYYGDGAVRQMAPLAPALHLGANRLLIIGMRAAGDGGVSSVAPAPRAAPTLGQLAGFALDNLFTDQIYSDLEQHRAREPDRCACSPRCCPARAWWRRSCSSRPRDDPREIAAEHLASLPPALKALLRVMRRQQHGRRPAGQLPDVRGRVHARADRAGSARYAGARGGHPRAAVGAAPRRTWRSQCRRLHHRRRRPRPGTAFPGPAASRSRCSR